MPYNLDDPLVLGLSSRALFALDDSNLIFEQEGMAAYRAHQREHEDVPLEPGTAFPLVRGLLRLNELADERLVEVIVISRNDADSGMRIFNSIESNGLDITRGAFTDGGASWAYAPAFKCDLFLSADREDVRKALVEEVPAALVLDPPERVDQDEASEVRIAFDGDAVLFDGESERVFQTEGLEAFLNRENALADEPMNPGPFKRFLDALTRIQAHFDDPENSPIRTALVTARNAPAHKRVVNTLRSWGVRLDETFFLGGIEKAPVLEALRPHIFFDDQLSHLTPASRFIPSAHVVGVGEQMNLLDDSKSGQASAPPESAAAEEKAEVPKDTEPPAGENAEQGPRLKVVGEEGERRQESS
jgi:5'-nucleotidase